MVCFEIKHHTLNFVLRAFLYEKNCEKKEIQSNIRRFHTCLVSVALYQCVFYLIALFL